MNEQIRLEIQNNLSEILTALDADFTSNITVSEGKQPVFQGVEKERVLFEGSAFFDEIGSLNIDSLTGAQRQYLKRLIGDFQIKNDVLQSQLEDEIKVMAASEEYQTVEEFIEDLEQETIVLYDEDLNFSFSLCDDDLKVSEDNHNLMRTVLLLFLIENLSVKSTYRRADQSIFVEVNLKDFLSLIIAEDGKLASILIQELALEIQKSLSESDEKRCQKTYLFLTGDTD